MKMVFKKYFPYFILFAILLVLTVLNIKAGYLPTGDQALLEYMGKQAHNNYWSQNINGYVSNQIYIFSELVYYLDFVFTSSFVKYLFLFYTIIIASYVVLYNIFFKLTKGDRVFSALATLPFFISRFAIGGEFWGMTNISQVQGRSFYMPFFFLIYYFTFWALEQKHKQIKYLFFMGLFSALSFFAYPGGGFYIPIILALTLFLYVLLRRINFKSFLSYLLGCMVGYIPTILNVFFNKDARIDGILSQYLQNKAAFDVDRFNEIIFTRLPHIFGKGWSRMAAELLFLGLIIAFIFWKNKKEITSKESDISYIPNKEFIRFSSVFFVSVALVTFGIPLLQKILVDTQHWPYFFFEQLRSSRYFFPPLLFIISQYLYILYLKKDYKWFWVIFCACFFSFRFFQPIINDILFHTLPQDFRTKYGLARTNFFESDEKIQSQGDALREVSNFMRIYGNTQSKVFVVADDDLHLAFRNISHLNTNNMWKEISLFIIQRPLEADAVMKDVQETSKFMYVDSKRLKVLLKEQNFTDLLVARGTVTDAYIQSLEKENLDILKVQKQFLNSGFIVYKLQL